MENHRSIEIDYVEKSTKETTKTVSVTDATVTPYEYTALVNYRATELSMGVPPLIKYTGKFHPISIAKEEINKRVLPLFIERKIPDNRTATGFRSEMWDIREMNIRDC